MNIFSGFSESEKSKVKYVISDVDDTITSDGLLLPQALDALYKLRDRGIKTILVTGGSAGWADGYIRQWPVDAVIAESGALILAHGKGGKILYSKNPALDPDAKEKKDKLIRYTAGLAFSSDQYARQYDIAYEKSALQDYERRTLANYVKAMGGVWRESSIHINVGFGHFDKHTSLSYFMDSLYSIDSERLKREGIYFGDSLNDSDMFAYMPLSVGMHSVEDMRSSFPILPRYITNGYGGDGFVEAAKALVEE